MTPEDGTGALISARADELRALRERVQEATGPDRELDAALWWLLFRRQAERTYWSAATGKPYPLGDRPPKNGSGWLAVRAHAPILTASIDAALALAERVLPGARIVMTRKPLSYAFAQALVGEARAFGASRAADGELALCICEAILTALIAQAEEAVS